MTTDAFLEMLSTFSSRLERREIPLNAAHDQLASVVVAFFRQAHTKCINDTVVRNGKPISLLRSRK